MNLKQKKTRIKKSFIWKYVTQVTEINNYGQEIPKNRCSFCGTNFACKGGNTSTTRKHLLEYHFALLDKEDIPGLQNEIGQGPQKLVQRSLSRYMFSNSKDSKDNALKEYPRAHPKAMQGDIYLGLLLVKDLRPLHDCNSQNLANFIHVFDPKYNMPCPSTLRTNVLIPMFDETKNAIKRILDPINDIAFTTDAWSSRNNHSYITVTAHAVDSNCNLHAVVLKTFEMVNRHTSENLLEGIMDVIDDWELSQKNLTFVSDNASDIKHALKDLSGYCWLGCASHNLNLICQEITKINEVSTLINKCKNLVSHIKHSHNLMNILRVALKDSGFSESLTVLQECSTRWWSLLLMLLRIKRIWGPLVQAIIKGDKSELMLTKHDLENIDAMIDLLKPFKEISDTLEGETYVTVSMVHSYMISIKKKINRKRYRFTNNKKK